MMRYLSSLKEGIGPWVSLAERLEEAKGLLELALGEGDTSLIEEIDLEIKELEGEVGGQERELLFSGEYDRGDAILAIHAGAGGTESQDWAEMLLRMYLRWAEKHRFATRIPDTTPGEEAGMKSATVEVAGRNAYGYLKAERGVHRLVRLSPFDAAHRRHTSFALVEVMPSVNGEIEVKIDPRDLRVDTFRASGAGGQHVNKTSSAVRITHLPTGIVATCQNERSQAQNKELAMKVLRARLLALEREKREEERARLKGKHVSAGWGNQIRSYVLHPYNMVKDHRSGRETADTGGVLDGDLDGFMEDYLKATIGEE